MQRINGKNILLKFFFLFLIFLPFKNASAQTVVVTDDAYVQANNPTTNYGLSAALALKNNGSNNVNVRLSYLKFDLSNTSSSFPTGHALNLVVTTANQGSIPTPPQNQIPNPVAVGPAAFSYEVWGLLANTDWAQGSITWNTALASPGLGYNYPDGSPQARYGFNPNQAKLLATCSVPAYPISALPYVVSCKSSELLNFMNQNIGQARVTLLMRRPDTNAQANFGFAALEDRQGIYASTFGPAGLVGISPTQGPTANSSSLLAATVSTGTPSTAVNNNTISATLKGTVSSIGSDFPSLQFEYKEAGASTWTTIELGSKPLGTYNYVVNGLLPATQYDFKVCGTNVAGTQCGSTVQFTTTATSTTVPGAPSAVYATAGNAQISVAFTEPTSNGGSAITGYTASCTSSNGGTAGSVSGASSPVIVAGLTNDKDYTCSVLATNSIGNSTASAASNTATPAIPVAVPNAPTISTATAGNAQASVTFTAPTSDGGAAITGYTATCTSSNGGTSGSITGTTSPLTVAGLTNGKDYTCSVLATNSVGDSTASAASNSVTPATVPNAPTIGTTTAGNAQASVAFTAPTSDGGAAITGYTATCTSSNGGTSGSITGTTSPLTVAGLTNGKDYTCSVLATNIVGDSTASAASNAVTPQAPTPTAIPTLSVWAMLLLASLMGMFAAVRMRRNN